MIKLVYVIVGAEKTEYLNMLRISLASARKHMPDIDIELVTDTDTAQHLNAGDIPQKYRATVVAVPVGGKYNTVEKSRVLKTNLRELVRGDFLFLDTDTIICTDISGYVPEGSVNFVLDAHCLLNEQENHGEPVKKAARERGLKLDNCVKYYNSGVILTKDDDNARLFFKKWHELWNKTKQPNMHHDQYSLNAVNTETDLIHELDGTWNCQMTANDRAFRYLRNVKILHYLSLQNAGIYRLNRRELMTSAISDEQIREIIDNPEQQFCPFHFYADDSAEYQIMQQSHFAFILRLYTRHPKLYRFGEKLLSKFRK